MALDGSGNVYISGVTASSTFPTTGGVVQPSYPGSNGFTGFISKLSPDGTAILWSSYLGGNGGNSFVSEMVLDGQGHPWIGGTAQGGTNFPISPGAYQATSKGGYEGSITEFSTDGTQLLYSTYVGGAGDDPVQGLAVDSNNNVYATGNTTSRDFPVSSNAYQSAFANGDPVYDGGDIFFLTLGAGTIGVVSPMTGGNNGDTTITISGAGFQQGATCALVQGGTTVQASSSVPGFNGTQLTCSFPLKGTPPGSYDVVVTNPGGTALTAKGAFTVQNAAGPQVWVNVTGRSATRVGVPQTFYVTYGNSGDTNAYFVPIFIQTPSNAPFTYTAVHPPALSNGVMVDFSDVPQTYQINGQTSAALVIPVIPPGGSFSIPVTVTAADDPNDFSITAYTTTSPLATSRSDVINGTFSVIPAASVTDLSLMPHAGGSTAAACLQDIISALLSAIPGFSQGRCVGAIVNGLSGVIAQSFDSVISGNPTAPINWGDFAKQFIASAGAPCLQAAVGAIPFANLIAALYNAYSAYQDCNKYLQPLLPKPMKPVKRRKAIDPNEKSGPAGDNSASRFITGSQPLSYTVGFENQATATLPAAQVVVTDQLDPTKVDLSTVTLGDIAFGTNVITLPTGTSNYTTTYNLNSSLSVRIQGSVNIDTGLLKWTFTSIDPATGLPPSDPTIGFLPPDTDGIKGQGTVVFSVMPKAGLPTGTQISNLATVFFDANAPIVTPAWLNTLDVNPPSSRVSALAGTQAQLTFPVAWSGTDVGSAISSYTIYVSDNGGAYNAWQTGVKVSTANFSGLPGHRYSFYSIATDGAGNVEGAKSAAEATTMISGNAGSTALTVSKTHGGYFGPGQVGAQYQVVVSNAAGAAPSSGNVNVTENLPAGITLVSMTGSGWTCAANTCNRGDVLSGGASYPPITVTVNVAASAGPMLTNMVNLSGGGSLPSSGNDATSIMAGPAPFGSFDTPTNNSAVTGAVAVTGWAVSTAGIAKVDIWREPNSGEIPSAGGLVYIGDAVQVNGARPDVAQIYSGYPGSNQAGWGLQMLTNELPSNVGAGVGNGTYKLHAIAHANDGQAIDLGTRTITVNNAASVLPFGTIDTPGQGATASGAAYVDFGWVVTPVTSSVIPKDGSTITVYIDNQPVGHPVYNQFRADIAALFPGLQNSGGAVGYLVIDTTKFANGFHTIAWGVVDGAGNAQGIGSRFFRIQN